MQFVSVRDLRGKSAQVWQELQKQKEIVITSNGKPIAILSSVSENTIEESLIAIRRSRAISAVDVLQRQSVEVGTDSITLKEVNQEIAKTRKTHTK